MRRFMSLIALFLVSVLSVTRAQTDGSETKTRAYETSTIVVVTGSTHDLYVSDNFKDAKAVRVDNVSDIVPTLQSGRAKYSVQEYPTYTEILKSFPELQLDNPNLFEAGLAVAFSKGNESLRDEFDKFFVEFRETDTYKDIVRRWIDNEGGDIPKIELPAGGKLINVAVSSSTLPYVTFVNGQVEGHDIELLRHFAKAKAYNLKFHDMAFAAVITSISSGKTEMAVSGISVTEERKKNILFSEPFQYVPSVVFSIGEKKVNVDNTSEVGISQALRDDIMKTSLLVSTGTSHDIFVTKDFEGANIVRADNYPDMLPMLQTGRAKYAILDLPAIEEVRMADSTVVIVDSNIMETPLAIAFPKKNTALCDEFNAFYDKFKETDEYKSIITRWIDGEGGDIPVIEENKKGKLLEVATSTGCYPYVATVDGELQGHDIEIIRYFARDNGYRVNIIDMTFPGLISSVSTGRCDVAVSGLSVTPEREKNILFSKPYSIVKAGIFTLKKHLSDDVLTTEVEGKGLWDTFVETFKSNVIDEGRYKLILSGLLVTIIISLFSIILGTILGGGICYMSMSKSSFTRAFAKLYIDIIRGVPVLVLLMINYYVIFVSTSFSAVTISVISFAMNFAAYVSEMFRSTIISIDKGQNEAGLAMGFTKIQTFVFVIAPQAIKRVMPVFKGEAISLVKMTSVVGYVAVQDLTKVSDIIRSRTFDAFFPLLVSALLYFLVAYAFTKLLDLSTIKITRRK